jgi:hypothetical protein
MYQRVRQKVPATRRKDWVDLPRFRVYQIIVFVRWSMICISAGPISEKDRFKAGSHEPIMIGGDD